MNIFLFALLITYKSKSLRNNKMTKILKKKLKSMQIFPILMGGMNFRERPPKKTSTAVRSGLLLTELLFEILIKSSTVWGLKQARECQIVYHKWWRLLYRKPFHSFCWFRSLKGLMFHETLHFVTFSILINWRDLKN